jgi:hypothetical protein
MVCESEMTVLSRAGGLHSHQRWEQAEGAALFFSLQGEAWFPLPCGKESD